MSLEPGDALPSLAAGLAPDQARTLYEAIAALGREVDLERMLRSVIHAATGVVGARYGALGVLDPTGTHLTDFLHVGMDDQTVDAIGPLPTGRGVLGDLIRDPHPLRVDDLSDHPTASGVPAHHPPMTSFLGVPVRVRGEVFGNLYLTDKRDGATFGPEDERAAVALAALAGLAVENARLHQRVNALTGADERERAGRELHDVVVQRLFSVGLALQSVADSRDDDGAATLTRAARDLDETIQQIRTGVLHLDDRPARAVRREVLELIEELAEQHDIAMTLDVDPHVDEVLAHAGRDELVHELLQATHSTITAVGLATARTAELRLRAHEDLVLHVSCDAPAPDVERHLGTLWSRASAATRPPAVEVDRDRTRVTWTLPVV